MSVHNQPDTFDDAAGLLIKGFLSIKLQAATSNGVQLGTPGYEVDLVYLACLAALVLGGTGPLSLDLST
jgi:hypothetical protein